MKDERPVVYIPCKLMKVDENKGVYTLAYFVGKAHLKSKKTIYNKSSMGNTYEYEVDCDDFLIRTPGFGYFDDILGWFFPVQTKTEFASKDYESCKRYINKQNKKLLEEFSEVTNSDIIEKVKKLEDFNSISGEMAPLE